MFNKKNEATYYSRRYGTAKTAATENLFCDGLPSADESLDRLLLYITWFKRCAFCNVDAMVGRSKN